MKFPSLATAVLIPLVACALPKHADSPPPLGENPHAKALAQAFDAARSAAAGPITTLDARDHAIELTETCQHELDELSRVSVGEGWNTSRAYDPDKERVQTSQGPMTLHDIGRACNDLKSRFIDVRLDTCGQLELAAIQASTGANAWAPATIKVAGFPPPNEHMESVYRLECSQLPSDSRVIDDITSMKARLVESCGANAVAVELTAPWSSFVEKEVVHRETKGKCFYKGNLAVKYKSGRN